MNFLLTNRKTEKTPFLSRTEKEMLKRKFKMYTLYFCEIIAKVFLLIEFCGDARSDGTSPHIQSNSKKQS